MKAREIMRRHMEVVTPDDSIACAAELMHYGTDACVPVVRDRLNPVLVGLITGRDIAVRCVARHHSLKCRAGDHMTPLPLYTLRPEDDVDEAEQMMNDTEVRRIPIINDDGVLVGVIRDRDLRTAIHARAVAPQREAQARPRLRSKAAGGRPGNRKTTRASVGANLTPIQGTSSTATVA